MSTETVDSQDVDQEPQDAQNDSDGQQTTPPQVNDRGFPDNTPWRDMTPEQQVAYWRHQARKHENAANARADYDTLKAKASKLDQLQRESMSEQERAVQAARDEARTEAMREFASRMVDAKFEALAAGRTVNGQPLDVTAVLEGVNRGFYLTDAGEVDADKVSRFLDSVAPKVDESTQRQQRQLDYGQGRRANPKASTGDQFAAAVESFFH